MENNSTWPSTQPSPTSWTPKNFALGPTVLYILGAVICTFAASIAFLVFELDSGRFDLRHPNAIPALDQLVSNLVLYAILLPYLLYFLPRVAGRSLAELGFRAPNSRQIGIGLAGIFVMLVAVIGTSAVVGALTHYKGNEAAVEIMKQMTTPFGKGLFVVVAAVLAPIVEELAFRAFLFNAIERYAPLWSAILLSGLLFGSIHVQSPSDFIPVAVPLAVGGMVLAGVYWISRSYWSNVITHAGFNLIQVLAFFVYHVKT